jgi:hypothetical protein
MPKRTSKTGSELFIVDNSDDDWKVQRYLHDWCGLSEIRSRIEQHVKNTFLKPMRAPVGVKRC